ncbi:MAG: flagellar filament capping protein FliD [Chitinispirillaceae bacterium]|nr:flagellar filament capping protein FliD [Chitinispirillaceae bacterium]
MSFQFSLESFSGVDLKALIEGLVDIERTKVLRVEKERAGYQLKIDAYGKLRSLLYDIKQKAADLSKVTSFDLFTSTSTDEKAVTVKGESGAVDGNYAVNVFQLAASEKMISADGLVTSQTESLASFGIGIGDISVGGVTITIDSDDTIQDLRSKINNATDTEGKKLGVTASVLKIADDNFRIVISAKETGSTGIEYQDLTGSTLQDLGLILDAAGDKGTVTQELRSGGDIISAFDALGVGETIVYEGTDHDGRTVSNTFVKSAGSTIDDFMVQVSATFHDTAEATTDAGGVLVITDKIGGASRLTINTMTVGSVDHDVAITRVGAQGAGVLSTGKNAYFSIEGLFMQESTNTVSEFVNGTTFELKGLAVDEAVTVGLTRDFEGIKDKFQELIDAYNALSGYAKDATKAGDPENEESVDGELMGDMTVRTIVNKVRDAFRMQYNMLGGDCTSFSLIGLKSDSKTGELSIDEKKFMKALENDLETVQQLFVTTGISDHSTISLGRSTDDTKPGRYILEEVDATHLRIREENSTTWYTSDARMGDVVIFSDGPAKGLSISAPQGIISVSAAFNFQKGLATVIDETIAKLTDTQDGVVTLRQNALQKTIARADDRIDTLNQRTERYRERLVRQFSDMETVLSGIMQQSGRITNMFGY